MSHFHAALFLVCSIASAAGEPVGFEAWLSDKLLELERSHDLVFVSRCEEAESGPTQERATLLIVPAQNFGLLIEERGGYVVNLAEFPASDPGGPDLETHGGLASRIRVSALIEFMLDNDFRLLRPFTAPSLARIPTGKRCPEDVPP